MPTCTPFQITRHHSKLSENETDAVIDIVARLIVTYLKERSECPSPGSGAVPVRTPEERR